MSDSAQFGQWTYAPMEPQSYSSSECSGEVRWMDGKLQQLFRITDYAGSSPSGVRLEWRDVPSVPPIQER